MSTFFEHEGRPYVVVKESPAPDEIIRGLWIRMCPDPFAAKPNRVGEVLSCREFWPIRGDGFGKDFRVDMFLNGDPNQPFWFFLGEEYCEIVKPQIEKAPSTDGGHSVPLSHSRVSRNIVVCFDGTWNENETQNTNTHRLFEFVDKKGAIKNYYSGVGIGMRLLSRGLDGITGRGVFRAVRAGYTFVRGNYVAGDEIFIFGFSRGAFAARHLAGMISRVGISEHSEVGYDQYRRMLGRNEGEANALKDVHFLGLFDCVPGNQYYMSRDIGSGVNTTMLEPGIRNFAHAVSINERRWSFKPLVFEPSTQARFAQVRFPGYHSDVGGEGNRPLNDFALAWMLKEAHACGLLFSNLPQLLFDANASGRNSDWPWTKFGIKCERTSLPEMSRVGVPVAPARLYEELSEIIADDA